MLAYLRDKYMAHMLQASFHGVSLELPGPDWLLAPTILDHFHFFPKPSVESRLEIWKAASPCMWKALLEVKYRRNCLADIQTIASAREGGILSYLGIQLTKLAQPCPLIREAQKQAQLDK